MHTLNNELDSKIKDIVDQAEALKRKDDIEQVSDKYQEALALFPEDRAGHQASSGIKVKIADLRFDHKQYDASICSYLDVLFAQRGIAPISA